MAIIDTSDKELRTSEELSASAFQGCFYMQYHSTVVLWQQQRGADEFRNTETRSRGKPLQ